MARAKALGTQQVARRNAEETACFYMLLQATRCVRQGGQHGNLCRSPAMSTQCSSGMHAAGTRMRN